MFDDCRVEDVTAVVERLTEGPVVLVGCSMGGWLSLVAAMQIPERIHGLVLYAPAINYVRVSQRPDIS